MFGEEVGSGYFRSYRRNQGRFLSQNFVFGGSSSLARELLISLRRCNLTRLELRSCCQITDAGFAAFTANGKSLEKLSCGSCAFGTTGMNAILDECSTLEELSVKRLKGLADNSAS
ncbi:hypothetical protein AAC387_Pa06g1365 [Persea americana]